jgi:uncharacterized protein
VLNINLVFENYYWIILAASFLTAIVSAAIGFLGGTILITIMAQFLPQASLVPVHAFNQLWANGSRAIFLLEHVRWNIVVRFALGTVLGAVITSFYALAMPEYIYNVFLGAMVLVMTMVPKEKWARLGAVSGPKWFITGVMISSIGMFVGAVGVFLGAMFTTESLEKKMMIATQAVCQVIVHAAKIAVFLYLGFKLGPWVFLIALMVFVTVAGSYVGTRILNKIPQELFMKIFKGLIILLALRLVWVGAQGYFAAS